MSTQQERLASAIKLRESEKHEEARQILLELHSEFPEDPQVNYQCAWIHDLLGLEREAIPFYEKAIQSGLSGDKLKSALLGMGIRIVVLANTTNPLMSLRMHWHCSPVLMNLKVFSQWAITTSMNIQKRWNYC